MDGGIAISVGIKGAQTTMSKKRKADKPQRRKPDLKEMFVTAETYQVAARTLGGMTLQPMGMVYAAPYCILGAFALEIYLKCLILLENGKYDDLHDLLELFGGLTPITQEKLRGLYARHLPFGQKVLDHFHEHAGGPRETASLELMLKYSKDAFIQLRYYYELEMKKGSGWRGMEISDCVRAVILEKRPDWLDALTRFKPKLITMSSQYPPGTLPTAIPRVE